MRLYHYLLKAVQDYIEDANSEKMDDEEIFETILYISKLRVSLTDEKDQNLADFLLINLIREGQRRGGLIFCNMTSDGCVFFNGPIAGDFFENLPAKTRKKLIEGALTVAQNRGIQFQKGARSKIRNSLLKQ